VGLGGSNYSAEFGLSQSSCSRVVSDIRSEDLEIILDVSLAKDGRITLKENGTMSTVGEVNFIFSEHALEM
jgi:hypothetical protein